MTTLWKMAYRLALGITLIIGCQTDTPEDQRPPAFAVFAKTTEVFGVRIYATAATGDDKVLHAAAVMAEYLDNDEDGVPDNQEVVSEMVRRRATLIMFRDVEEQEKLFQPSSKVLEMHELQNLLHHETHPGGAKRGFFDATLEEVLHLVTFAGYAYAYPEVFGERSGTSVAEALDLARGGHFEAVPDKYPESAWFTYYDETCDYSCQITEYLYWAITSILGGQDFPGRFEEIRQEWRLNTKEKVRNGDPMIYGLIKDPRYRFATILPDGHYRGFNIKLVKL